MSHKEDEGTNPAQEKKEVAKWIILLRTPRSKF